jgi:hypothetical protein
MAREQFRETVGLELPIIPVEATVMISSGAASPAA